MQPDMFTVDRPEDMLQDTLQQRALAAMKAAGINRGYIKRPFSLKTDQIVCEFWFRTGAYSRPDKAHMTPGVLQFTLYAPEATDPDRVQEIADSLKDSFDRKRWDVSPDGYVEIEQTKAVVLSMVREGKRIGIVDAGFDWHQ